MGEMKDFVDYTMEDPVPLVAGIGTAFVLIAVGSYKVVALAAGAAVTGVMYVCSRKTRRVCSYRVGGMTE
jgi:hypothetical protein